MNGFFYDAMEKRFSATSKQDYLKDKDLGSIAPGKLGDFFLVPGNSLQDIKAVKTI